MSIYSWMWIFMYVAKSIFVLESIAYAYSVTQCMQVSQVFILQPTLKISNILDLLHKGIIYTIRVECYMNIHSQIQIFVTSMKSIFAFDEYWLYNIREYFTNIWILYSANYSTQTNKMYSIFANIYAYTWVISVRTPQVSCIYYVLKLTVLGEVMVCCRSRFTRRFEATLKSMTHGWSAILAASPGHKYKVHALCDHFVCTALLSSVSVPFDVL